MHPFLLTSAQEHPALPFVWQELEFATEVLPSSSHAPPDLYVFDCRLLKVDSVFPAPQPLWFCAHVDII